MDSLSHIVLGACIGEAMLGKKIGKKAMLWGALANNFPDVDVFFTPFFHPVDALFVHRGITHSILFLILVTPIFGWLFSRIYPLLDGKGRSWASWNLFFLIAFLAHPLLDSCTVYGTGIFEPLSSYRLQFTSFFIVEPLYTLPLLISVFVLLILKKDSLKRKFWTRFGVYLSTIYLVFAIFNKLYIGTVFSNSMKKQNIHFSEYITSPTPLNNILWNMVAKDNSGFWFGYYSYFDNTKDVEFSFFPRNDSLAGDLLHNEVVQKLIRFSNGYYCFTICDDELLFNDLRFAFAGHFTCDADPKDFVFSFGLKKNDFAPFGIEVKRNAWRSLRFEGFSKLIERIKGI